MTHKIYPFSGHLAYNRSGLVFGMVELFLSAIHPCIARSVAFCDMIKSIQQQKIMNQ